jgi:CBS domain-containing protein
MIIHQLTNIVDGLRAGRAAEPVTVRVFLSWFGAQRRGWQIVQQIREQLAAADLVTVPDFESSWIDALIVLQSRVAGDADAPTATDTPGASAEEDLVAAPADSVTNWVIKDPTYRISKLAAANGGVTAVNPNASLAQALALMMGRDFSQLPVMTGDRNVHGIISWKTIGSRFALGHGADTVARLMELAFEVRADTSIFEAILLIVQNGYVLVRGEGNKITGIVTASDLSLQFQVLTEPFLLLSEIENLVRNMIGDRFEAEQLAAVRAPDAQNREVHSVADLTFGEYIRLLERPESWEQLRLTIDRVQFCKDLDNVRKIRNDVTHFDPDGITTEDLDTLRKFTRFLKELEAITRN